MGNFSTHDISPIIVNLVEDSESDLENSDDDEDEQQNAKLFHCYVQLPFRICLVQLCFFFKIIKQV
jgi:hypothetical protein